MNIPIISNTLAAMAYFPHDANDIDFGSKVSGLIFPVTPVQTSYYGLKHLEISNNYTFFVLSSNALLTKNQLRK